jgi:lipopolysaccharide biosynthesis glycosyltransferase
MKVLDICFASSGTYAPYMGVALASVLSSKLADEFCRFHILDDGIKDEDKRKLSSLHEQYSDFSISYYPIDGEVLSKFPMVDAHWNRTTYARLFMGSLLPKEVTRLIYLDCDVFVRKSLYNLFSVDLGKNLLGGVEDFGAMLLARKGAHPWPWHQYTYINAGVLLVDLARWREEGSEEKILSYLQKNSEPLQFADQDAINFVFCKQIKNLSCKWNGQVSWLLYKWNTFPKIKKYRNLLNTCPIVHFASPAKPWVLHSGKHKNTLEYQAFMAKTPWADSVKKFSFLQICKLVLKYWLKHPVFFFKRKFYQNFYYEGVCLLK